jgi:hypothetical protein
MKRFVLLLVFTLSTVIWADGPLKDTNVFGKEYLPYNPKLVLVYDSDFHETLSKTDLIANGIIQHENKANNFTYRQKFSMHPDGLYITETYQKIKVLLLFKVEKKVTYNKDLLKIPFPVKTGQQWTCDRTEYLDNGDSNKISLVSKCIGAETLKLKAGTFYTMKTESVIKSSDGSTNYIEEWIAPNVGLVKTRIKMTGGGLTGTVRDVLGLGELNFELVEIKSR